MHQAITHPGWLCYLPIAKLVGFIAKKRLVISNSEIAQVLFRKLCSWIHWVIVSYPTWDLFVLPSEHSRCKLRSQQAWSTNVCVTSICCLSGLNDNSALPSHPCCWAFVKKSCSKPQNFSSISFLLIPT